MVQISVVIPVHNAARYLGACLDSLRQQTFSDFEVVCVDDESTDASLEILEDYSMADSRFRYVTQQWAGAGVARNLGMSIARGKYLYFLDADDIVLPTLLEQLIEVAETHSSDIVLFQFQAFDEETGQIEKGRRGFNDWTVPAETVFAGCEVNETIFQIATPEPWIKFYLRSFITSTKLSFQALPRSNDVFFTWATLVLAQRIVVIEDAMVLHRVNLRSNLQSHNDATPLVFLEAMQAIRDFLEEHSLWNEEIKRSYINAVLDVSLYNLSTFRDEDNLRRVFHAVKHTLLVEMQAEENSENYFYYDDHAEHFALMRELDFEEYFFALYRNARVEHKTIQIEDYRRKKLLHRAEKHWSEITKTRLHQTEIKLKQIYRRLQKSTKRTEGRKA